jgi:hypothetical protein
MNLWDAIVSIFWFMLLVAWFWLLIAIISDLFRDHELGGGAKALWCIFLILVPWVGVLCYLIFRGRGMGERQMRQAAANERDFRRYVQEAAGSGGSGGVADELTKLTALRDAGTITPDEYEAAKARVLGGTGTGNAAPPSTVSV